ncbi:hypothetical protein LTR10_018863 [Elasticomyces elasticus]|uniref:Uncharacterized protein n=1 Tax=Exophiala sideris TaxID=1016849 RepID=A0ABR0IW21_9EURO|nr:hypothetical protein LTR10_018863 [Elasticomyces elasticus]KAK5021662.1 hypothetical protein LTS07_010833 [Exophiala sideris]KAK5024833.1 hypothetical protein LTR13_010676 [Exophiala sideris]KAK5049800.1 hypothetical protein LTR69_010857 [Exophiala sideris]KAK5176781.1 hypothetical protein LTR44_010724 [Eurotiomycetes sp. CCFEE 6388]
MGSTDMTSCVLVTGGGTGIGASAVKFLVESYKANVVALTLQASDDIRALEKAHPDSFVLHMGDVTKLADMEGAVQTMSTKFGRIDSVLVCAGLEPAPSRIRNLAASQMMKVYEVNVIGALLAFQQSLPLLAKSHQERPRIIMLSSTGDKGHRSGRVAYCASKAGMTRLIETLAHEERGFDVYGVYPGLTETPLAKGLLAGTYNDVLFPEDQVFYRQSVEDGTVDSPDWCGEASAKLAAWKADGMPGKTASYSEHVPECRYGIW